MKEVTLAQWLEGQLNQLDNPAYLAGYMAGQIDGQKRAFGLTLDAINSTLKEQSNADNAKQ
jgi:glycerol uptake facilitator-like aquaporin